MNPNSLIQQKIDLENILDEINQHPPLQAVIDESSCIGCTKCIQACPVDAIIGTIKSMHAILPSVCIGCSLCVDPCPVDCIAMKTNPFKDKHQSAIKQAASRHSAQKKRQQMHAINQSIYRQKRKKQATRKATIAAALKRHQNKNQQA